MIKHGFQSGGHQQRQSGLQPQHVAQPGRRIKTPVQRDFGTCIEGWQRLYAQATHMKHRQDGEHVVISCEAMRVARNYAIGQQTSLGVDCTFGLARGT